MQDGPRTPVTLSKDEFFCLGPISLIRNFQILFLVLWWFTFSMRAFKNCCSLKRINACSTAKFRIRGHDQELIWPAIVFVCSASINGLCFFNDEVRKAALIFLHSFVDEVWMKTQAWFCARASASSYQIRNRGLPLQGIDENVSKLIETFTPAVLGNWMV